MLRKLQQVTTKTIFMIKNSCKQPLLMQQKQNKYFFSTAQHHPTIQKILNGQDITHTESILTQIGTLDDKNRDVALKLVLKNIYAHKIPTSTLSNAKFVNQARKSPLIYLDSLSYKVKELMKRLNDQSLKNDSSKHKEVFSEINQNFIICFQTLKKIPEQQKLKHQVLLYKRFADYNLLYLSGQVETHQKKDVLLKCCEFYRKTALLMDKLLKLEGQKINHQKQQLKKSNDSQEQKSLRLNSMQESLRMLIQTNAQNALHLFKALNQLQDRQSNEGQFDKNIMEMLTSFQRAIAWYIILKGFSTHSIFYHRIKKIQIDLNNYYKRSIMPKRGGQKVQDAVLEKDYSKQLENLYSQTKQDLQKLSNQQKYVANAQELSLLMLSIRVQGLKRLKIDNEPLKEKLFIQIKSILDVISNSSNRKAVSSKLGKIATQILQAQSNKPDQVQNHHK